ncbi:MAG: glycosyltransferase family 4 protein [Opitutales bacterium]
MKILFVTASSGSQGGGELYLLKLAGAMKRLGHAVALACSRHSRMDRLAEQFGECGDVFRFEYTNTYDRPLKSLHYVVSRQADFPGLDEAVASWAPDVLHLNKQNLEDGLDLLKSFYEQSVPVVQTIHILRTPSALGARFGEVRDWVAKRFLRKHPMHTIVIASEYECKRFSALELIPAGLIERIINGVPPVCESPGYNGETPLRFVAVARLHEQKRPLLWLEWVSRLSKLLPDAQFDWIGGGVLQSVFEAKIRELDLRNVRFHGWLDEPEAFISQAHYMLHSAEYEGLPFALLEAISAGIPLIVAPGIYQTQAELNPAMIDIDQVWKTPEILTSTTEYNRLRENARSLYHEHFSVDEMCEKTVLFYAKAITEAQR